MARRPRARPVHVRDTDPRSYVGGGYLNGLVAKLCIAPLNRWSERVTCKDIPTLSAPFIGFRCYRTSRKVRGQ